MNIIPFPSAFACAQLPACYLRVLPSCVPLPRLPPQPVLHSSLWRYRVGFSAPSYLSAWRWKAEIMENSGVLQMIDSFQLGLVNLAYVSSTLLFSSSHLLGFDRFLSSSCPFLSFLLSLHLFLPYTCMDNLLPASANPFQTPPYPFHHKCQNSPQGPKPNCGMCNSDSLTHCSSMAFSDMQTETTEKSSHWWLTS